MSGIGVDRPEECVHFFGAHVVVDFDARGSVNLWCTALALVLTCSAAPFLQTKTCVCGVPWSVRIACSGVCVYRLSICVRSGECVW